jgi:hypothetical protein
VHSHMGWRLTEWGTETRLSTLGAPLSRYMRLAPVRVYDLLRTMRGDCMQLSGYVRHASHILSEECIGGTGKDVGAWPHGPAIKSHNVIAAARARAEEEYSLYGD